MNTKPVKSKPDTNRIPVKRATKTTTPRGKLAGNHATSPAIRQAPPSKRKKAQSTAQELPVPEMTGASKQSRIIAKLKTAPGASIAQLVELTGWQPHSVRGVISGVLRKKLGLEIKSEQCPRTGEHLYRILGSAAV